MPPKRVSLVRGVARSGLGPGTTKGPGGRAPCLLWRNFGPGAFACGERSRAVGEYLFHIGPRLRAFPGDFHRWKDAIW